MLYSELFLVLAPLAYARERFPRSVMVHTCSITGAVSAQAHISLAAAQFLKFPSVEGTTRGIP